MEKGVTVEQIIDNFQLDILNIGESLEKEIVLSAVHRPGAELTGFPMKDIPEVDSSIHILGKEEMKYLQTLDGSTKKRILEIYFSYHFPCAIVTAEADIDKLFIQCAKQCHKTVLHTNMKTESFIGRLKKFLESELAPEIVLNKFTLLEIFGMGVLIYGYSEAKIGTTIELIEKGHKFISDSLLTLKKVEEDKIIGSNGFAEDSDEGKFILNLTRGHTVDVVDFYGIGATRKSKQVNLVVSLEKWNEKKFYDRLGIDQDSMNMLGVDIPKITLPVRKGRNLAIIVETAAINQRLKLTGVNSALYFLMETEKLIKQNKEKREEVESMGFIKTLKIIQLKEKFGLNVLNGLELLDEKLIINTSLHRPALEFSGFYDVLEEGGENRLQLIADAEFKYLESLPKKIRENNLAKYLDYDFPAIILSGVEEIPDYFLKKVEEKNKILLSTTRNITELIADVNEFLEIYFAPSLTMHGVYVELFGFGVLLTGKSGIGKSETALELIHRGHRLIADDMVKFTRHPNHQVIGSAEKLPYFMEIRGLGIIDVKALYGLGAVRMMKQLDFIIEMKELVEDDYLTQTNYLETDIDILGIPVKKAELYISSGRNAAAMVEVITMSLRSKKIGYDPEFEYKQKSKALQEIEDLIQEKNIEKEKIMQEIKCLVNGNCD